MVCLIFHTAISIISRKNGRITKTSFSKSQHFFFKSERIQMLGTPLPCSFLFAFQWPSPPSPQRTYFLNDPLCNFRSLNKGLLWSLLKENVIVRKHFFCKMNTLVGLNEWLVFEVNCHAKEPLKNGNTRRNILKYKSFVEHNDVIWKEYH